MKATKIHRARTLAASLTVLLVAASFYASHVRAEPRVPATPSIDQAAQRH